MTDSASESGGSPCTSKGTRQAIVVMTSHNISEGSFGKMGSQGSSHL